MPNHEIKCRVTSKELKRIKGKAESCNMSLNKFLRYIALNMDIEISLKGGKKE